MSAAIWYYIHVLREKDECSLTYRSGREAGRGSHASGEAEWSVRGVGNLTRAAYATAYEAFQGNRQFQVRKRSTELRYVGNHVACLLIMFSDGRLAMPLERRVN